MLEINGCVRSNHERASIWQPLVACAGGLCKSMHTAFGSLCRQDSVTYADSLLVVYADSFGSLLRQPLLVYADSLLVVHADSLCSLLRQPLVAYAGGLRFANRATTFHPLSYS